MLTCSLANAPAVRPAAPESRSRYRCLRKMVQSAAARGARAPGIPLRRPALGCSAIRFSVTSGAIPQGRSAQITMREARRAPPTWRRCCIRRAGKARRSIAVLQSRTCRTRPISTSSYATTTQISRPPAPPSMHCPALNLASSASRHASRLSGRNTTTAAGMPSTKPSPTRSAFTPRISKALRAIWSCGGCLAPSAGPSLPP